MLSKNVLLHRTVFIKYYNTIISLLFNKILILVNRFISRQGIFYIIVSTLNYVKERTVIVRNTFLNNYKSAKKNVINILKTPFYEFWNIGAENKQIITNK